MIKRFLVSLFAPLHAALFLFMCRRGLVLCDTDPTIPQLVEKALEKIKEKTDDHEEQMTTLRQMVTDIAQKMVAGEHLGGGGSINPLYELNEYLENSEPLKALIEGHTRGVKLHLPKTFMSKAITSDSGIVAPQNVPGIFNMARRRPTVRDLLRTIPITSGGFTYVRQVSRTNNAAPVSEGTAKPETPADLDFITGAVITLAHFSHLSVQILADMPMLGQFLQDELRWGLQMVEETQLLKGSGVGQNLPGLYTLATAATDVSGTMADDLRKAIAQLAASDYEASGIVINPADWASIELVKDDEHRYLIGEPRGSNPAQLWNLPVVATNAMTAGTFLVGDFQACGFIADRQSPTLDIATQDGDDFVKNMLKLRMEERLGLAVTMPAALIKGVLA